MSVAQDPKQAERYKVRVLPNHPVLAGAYGDPQTVHGREEAIQAVKALLDRTFKAGDTIEYAAILFTSVDDAVHAVRVAVES